MPYEILFRKLVETLKRFNLSESDIFYSIYSAGMNMFRLSMQDWTDLPEWRISYEFWYETGATLEFIH